MILTTISVIWIAFEVLLVVRDRIQGKGQTGKDSGTRYINFLAIFLGITVAGVLSWDSRFFFPSDRPIAGFWVGIGTMLLGFALRIWSVVTLGASFRTTVETHVEQHVIKRGPYRLVRHPSYSGLILMCCGFGLAVENWLSLTIAVILPLMALVYRIQIEEKVLVSSLGSEYVEYQGETKKLVPWLW